MTTSGTTGTATTSWHRLDITRVGELTDARLQFHHAAQFASATGISFLPPRPDDSHTNLEWIPSIAALASNVVPTATPFRVAVRALPLAILIVDDNDEILKRCGLNGHSIEDAVRWLRVMLPDFGVDPRRYTLNRHFKIPTHAVATGAPFDTSRAEPFEELSNWFADSAMVLSALAAATPKASEVRCWPHHFDLATLIEVAPAAGAAPARTVGVGLAPGDEYYAEPYFYVNMFPSPAAAAKLLPLAGNGFWHRQEWTGAVLPASRVQPTEQRSQIESFVASAVRACTELVSGTKS